MIVMMKRIRQGTGRFQIKSICVMRPIAMLLQLRDLSLHVNKKDGRC